MPSSLLDLVDVWFYSFGVIKLSTNVVRHHPTLFDIARHISDIENCVQKTQIPIPIPGWSLITIPILVMNSHVNTYTDTDIGIEFYTDTNTEECNKILTNTRFFTGNAKGSIRIKKCHKKWKKSTRGGRGQQKTSKSPKFEIWTF